mmetsp:Transcript_10330/g.30664  ORF Transcript_10330/g.30664 Transcript_10330/m.30664 type:complete len:208 (+) Transcript_10330:273-896(+)
MSFSPPSWLTSTHGSGSPDDASSSSSPEASSAPTLLPRPRVPRLGEGVPRTRAEDVRPSSTPSSCSSPTRAAHAGRARRRRMDVTQTAASASEPAQSRCSLASPRHMNASRISADGGTGEPVVHGCGGSCCSNWWPHGWAEAAARAWPCPWREHSPAPASARTCTGAPAHEGGGGGVHGLNAAARFSRWAFAHAAAAPPAPAPTPPE